MDDTTPLPSFYLGSEKIWITLWRSLYGTYYMYNNISELEKWWNKSFQWNMNWKNKLDISIMWRKYK